jgi:hypothetical protein
MRLVQIIFLKKKAFIKQVVVIISVLWFQHKLVAELLHVMSRFMKDEALDSARLARHGTARHGISTHYISVLRLISFRPPFQFVLDPDGLLTKWAGAPIANLNLCTFFVHDIRSGNRTEDAT